LCLPLYTRLVHPVVHPPGTPCGTPAWYILWYTGLCLPYTLWYTGLCLPGTPPGMYRVYLPVYALPVPCCRWCICLLYTGRVHTRVGTPSDTVRTCRFIPVVEERRSLCAERRPFSPQDKPSLPAETGIKRPRNPLQKALLYKDPRNMPTPQQLLSNPP